MDIYIYGCIDLASGVCWPSAGRRRRRREKDSVVRPVVAGGQQKIVYSHSLQYIVAGLLLLVELCSAVRTRYRLKIIHGPSWPTAAIERSNEPAGFFSPLPSCFGGNDVVTAVMRSLYIRPLSRSAPTF